MANLNKRSRFGLFSVVLAIAMLIPKVAFAYDEFDASMDPIRSDFVAFLVDPLWINLLMIVFVCGIVFELFFPGTFVGITLSILSLGAYFTGSLLSGIASTSVLYFLGFGFLLIIAEFFLPGGILGAIGTMLLVTSLIMSTEDTGRLIISLTIAVITGIVLGVILSKGFGRKMKFFNRLILEDSSRKEEGFISSVDYSYLIGKQGTALTDLRPAGMMSYEDQRIDVISEGGFVHQGEKVIVLRTDGPSVIVRKIVVE